MRGEPKRARVRPTEFVERVAVKNRITETMVKAAMDAIFEEILCIVVDERKEVTFSGFGRFHSRKLAERVSVVRDLQGEGTRQITIPERRRLLFQPSKVYNPWQEEEGDNESA